LRGAPVLGRPDAELVAEGVEQRPAKVVEVDGSAVDGQLQRLVSRGPGAVVRLVS
jgi:hypothetical protein